MTFDDIVPLLESTGLPVTYFAWPENPEAPPPPLPWIAWYEDTSNSFFADGTTYAAARHIVVEFYAKQRDMDGEKKIETALCGVAWTRYVEHIDTEKCFCTTYEFEV